MSSPLLIGAFDDRVIGAKTLDLDHIEVQTADLITDKCLRLLQTLIKCGITFTGTFRVMIFVCQVVL
jgi:hypothetical protein